MAVLSAELRGKLERAVQSARDAGEIGARKALEALAVQHHEPHASMTAEQKALRNRLRAHGRQLGDLRDARRGTQEIDRLTHECAYEHWHRMLFARFLAENHLLIEPTSGVPISMVECEEIARESGEDPWALASRFAQRMLPQIFRPDDPVLEVALPPETRQELERLLGGLSETIFTADDSLGWTYQFWQSAEKNRVNDRVKSREKITGRTLPAVTQLFTEHYMVLFLLHNTIGAWHAGKVLARQPELAAAAASEQELRAAVALDGYSFDYLRFVRLQDESGAGPWRPAAGTFDGWPRRTAELKVLDPCCGSGHFLVAAFELLVRLRMTEEGLDLEDAIRAVLGENLFGLELDPRCTQIAAFYLALAAWKWIGRVDEPPLLNIACSGLAPNTSKEDWLALAERAAASGGMPVRRDLFRAEDSLLSSPLKAGMEAIYDLFAQAPELGSLIDPALAMRGSELFGGDFASLRPHLAQALAAERGNDEAFERAVAAQGMAKAAEILAGEYTLVITNVPYKKAAELAPPIASFMNTHYSEAKTALETVFVSRILRWLATGGSTAVVTPQNWLFLTSYRKLRERLLKERTWNLVARLGEHAFESSAAAGAFAAMLVLSGDKPDAEWQMGGVDVSAPRGQRPIYADEKARLLRGEGRLMSQEAAGRGAAVAEADPAASADADDAVQDAADGAAADGTVRLVPQAEQLKNPDARIALDRPSNVPLMQEYANAYQGNTSGDNFRFMRSFWELPKRERDWEWFQSPDEERRAWGGCSQVIFYEQGQGTLATSDGARIQGQAAHGRSGVTIGQMSSLPASIYAGGMFDMNCAALVATNAAHVPAIFCFCTSNEFPRAVRRIDAKLNVTNATLAKVPFDLTHWQKVAAEQYPDGLPEPESDDPTQWLFHGRPTESTAPLQIAVARLLGYRWPAELDDQMRLSQRARALVGRCAELARFADDDGIVCIPSVRGERPAADRLAALLAVCDIRPDRDLDTWLRESFFDEHCDLFHHRPFIWHIWDGRKDGFHALVNYHTLAAPAGGGRRLLESVAYSYLGGWIDRQKAEQREGKDGADARLAAALDLQDQLKKILEGEPPYDIFVRWKPLHEQPIGWEPDINDGVRLNIRPFLSATLRKGGKAGAGILRSRPGSSLNWKKDRGQEPQSLRPKASFPWFWSCEPEKKPEHRQDFMGGATFDGNRWNDLHYSSTGKRAARERHIDGART